MFLFQCCKHYRVAVEYCHFPYKSSRQGEGVTDQGFQVFVCPKWTRRPEVAYVWFPNTIGKWPPGATLSHGMIQASGKHFASLNRSMWSLMAHVRSAVVAAASFSTRGAKWMGNSSAAQPESIVHIVETLKSILLYQHNMPRWWCPSPSVWTPHLPTAPPFAVQSLVLYLMWYIFALSLNSVQLHKLVRRTPPRRTKTVDCIDWFRCHQQRASLSHQCWRFWRCVTTIPYLSPWPTPRGGGLTDRMP
jgi:hypothetical protein